MSITICREEQGKGYGTEAIKWALEWAFLAGGLHRVGIGCFSFNEGARRLYERLGFVVEGRAREIVWKNGCWHDVIEMGMLEGEWRERYLIDGKGTITLGSA
jgi:RimJ/RimL family protein N-acetyltransferase